ncbi:hypothetical protein ACVMAJ_006941 [Bradyrhizobium sp. USDA 4448]
MDASSICSIGTLNSTGSKLATAFRNRPAPEVALLFQLFEDAVPVHDRPSLPGLKQKRKTQACEFDMVLVLAVIVPPNQGVH